MNKTNGSSEPSVDEILASIRASIAEEEQHSVIAARVREVGRASLHSERPRPSDIDLPSILKSTPQPAPERHTKLLGRLADAFLGVDPITLPNGAPAPRAVFPARAPMSLDPGVSAVPIAPIAPVVNEPVVAAQPADPVARVMVPFKDTRFAAMAASEASKASAAAALTGAAPPPAAAPAASVSPEAALSQGRWQRGPDAQQAPAVSGSPLGMNRPAPAPQPAPHSAPDPAVLAASLGGYPLGTPPPPQSHPSPAITAPPTPREPGGVEDSAAQLLRPMLRQWLSENMPKIVEEALRSEVASSNDPPRGPRRD